MEHTEIAKRKPGFARRKGEVPATVEAQRRHRDRKSIEAMAESTAVAAAGAAARALTPTGLTDEVQQLIADSAEQVTKIIATNGPNIIQALVDRAIGGDTNAAALLTKFIVSPKTKIKLPMQPGSSIEEFADSLVAAATNGTLALEDADAGLRLLERHSAVSLNGSLTARLSALNAQLESARATGLIDASAALQRVPTMQLAEVL
jgi:hypothetical protein